jgi:hypothetical protein
MENRGTGAGGANTNINGLAFEDKTSNERNLIEDGFERISIGTGYYFRKQFGEKELLFFVKKAFKKYIERTFGIELCREPDEAYLWKHGDSYTFRCLEKKNQNVAGSVDTKLLAGPGFLDYYQRALGDKFMVEYAFCVSSYLHNTVMSKRWALHREFLDKFHIRLFCGDDADYFTKLNQWVYS